MATDEGDSVTDDEVKAAVDAAVRAAGDGNRLDALEAKLDAVLAALAKPVPAGESETIKFARSVGGILPPARAAGAFGPPPYPPPADAERDALAHFTAKLDGIPDVAVEARGWTWPEGASGRLQAQLIVAVEVKTQDQPEVQRRLNGVPGAKRAGGGPAVYDHCILAETGEPTQAGRRTDAYGLFVRVTVPRGE